MFSFLDDGGWEVPAMCAPNAKAPTLKARKRATPTNPTGLTEASASCKKGEQVVSAGFKSTAFIIPFEFRRDTKRRWVSNGLDFGDQDDTTTIAYCRKLKKKRKGRR